MESVMRISNRTSKSAILLTPLVSIMLICTTFAQPAAQDEPTLYERLGGLSHISLFVSDFVDVFIQDPVIMSNPAVKERKTPDTAPYVKFQVTAMVCQVTGGPCQYTGLDMKSAHKGLNVSPGEWDRMAEIFAATLEKHRVDEGAAMELLGIMGTTRDDIVVSGN